MPYLFLDCFLYDTLDATSNNHGVAQYRFSGYLQVNMFSSTMPISSSASAACKRRQVVIGTLQSIAPRTCIDALLRRILLFDEVVLQGERRSLYFSYLHRVACIG